MSSFSPSLKKLRVDSRGRVNVGALNPSGADEFKAAIDPQGRILLTPDTRVDEPAESGQAERAVEHG